MCVWGGGGGNDMWPLVSFCSSDSSQVYCAQEYIPRTVKRSHGMFLCRIKECNELYERKIHM